MADAPGEDHDMQDANALEDDEELQMALLASMAQVRLSTARLSASSYP
jgi:hypothetical protein